MLGVFKDGVLEKGSAGLLAQVSGLVVITSLRLSTEQLLSNSLRLRMGHLLPHCPISMQSTSHVGTPPTGWKGKRTSLPPSLAAPPLESRCPSLGIELLDATGRPQRSQARNAWGGQPDRPTRTH